MIKIQNISDESAIYPPSFGKFIDDFSKAQWLRRAYGQYEQALQIIYSCQAILSQIDQEQDMEDATLEKKSIAAWQLKIYNEIGWNDFLLWERETDPDQARKLRIRAGKAWDEAIKISESADLRFCIKEAVSSIAGRIKICESKAEALEYQPKGEYLLARWKSSYPVLFEGHGLEMIEEEHEMRAEIDAAMAIQNAKRDPNGSIMRLSLLLTGACWKKSELVSDTAFGLGTLLSEKAIKEPNPSAKIGGLEKANHYLRLAIYYYPYETGYRHTSTPRETSAERLIGKNRDMIADLQASNSYEISLIVKNSILEAGKARPGFHIATFSDLLAIYEIKNLTEAERTLVLAHLIKICIKIGRNDQALDFWQRILEKEQKVRDDTTFAEQIRQDNLYPEYLLPTGLRVELQEALKNIMTIQTG